MYKSNHSLQSHNNKYKSTHTHTHNKMSTKSILLPLALLIIFVSASQASRQLWDTGFSQIFGSKSGFEGLHGFHGKAGGAGGGIGNGDMTAHTCTAQGPCNGKKLTCPENCFKSSNVEKEGYKSTSKSGGCSFDCTNKCIASCN